MPEAGRGFGQLAFEGGGSLAAPDPKLLVPFPVSMMNINDHLWRAMNPTGDRNGDGAGFSVSQASKHGEPQMTLIRLPQKRRSVTIHRDEGPCDLLTVREAAAYVSVSDVSIRRWIKAKILRCYRVGRQIRIAREDLLNFIHQY